MTTTVVHHRHQFPSGTSNNTKFHGRRLQPQATTFQKTATSCNGQGFQSKFDGR
jgi:hypothetical protein